MEPVIWSLFWPLDSNGNHSLDIQSAPKMSNAFISNQGTISKQNACKTTGGQSYKLSGAQVHNYHETWFRGGHVIPKHYDLYWLYNYSFTENQYVLTSNEWQNLKHNAWQRRQHAEYDNCILNCSQERWAERPLASSTFGCSSSLVRKWSLKK